MNTWLIILTGLILLAGLLFFEKTGNFKGLLCAKTLLSALFVLCAAVQPRPEPLFFRWVFAGLACCLAGDVLLALPRDRMFLLGLIAFLVGHIFYVAAFVHLAEPNRLTLAGALLTLAVSAGIYVWLRPHLGTMHVPVVCYIIVISVMLCGAWSVLGTQTPYPGGRILVFTGAVCFYLSDIFVARDRFMGNAFANRLIGLPLYYTGQYMIAFSVGAV